MDTSTFRENVTDAIRFWEPRLVLYNLILAGIVLFYFVYFKKASPSTKTDLSLDMTLVLFLLAILANVAYCAAYAVDLFAQSSSYREGWRRYRWLMFLVGMVVAAILTRFFSIGIFAPVGAG